MSILKIKFFLILILSFSFNSLFGTTYLVINTNDSGVGSLRYAIQLGQNNDTIRIDTSLISIGSDTIFLNSKITFNKSLTIVGQYNNQDTLYISGNNKNEIFEISNTSYLKLDSLFFIDASAPAAIVLNNVDSLHFSNSYLGDMAKDGIDALNSKKILIDNSSFKNCHLSGINARSELGVDITVNNGHFIDNNIGLYFGVLEPKGPNHKIFFNIKIDESQFNNNRYSGVAFYTDNGNKAYFDFPSVYALTVNKSEFNNNSIRGIHTQLKNTGTPGSDLEIRVDSSTFANNGSGTSGAAILADAYFYNSMGSSNSSNTVSINHSTLSNNKGNFGGALKCLANGYKAILNLTINYSTLVHNSGNRGGAIFAHTQDGLLNNVKINNSTIAYNGADYGSGIYMNSMDPVEIKNSILALNYGSFNYPTIYYYNLPHKTNFDAVVSNGYNIFSDFQVSGSKSTDYLKIDSNTLNLSTLGSNGGPGNTCMPQSPSTAMNAGNPNDKTPAQNTPIVGIREIGAAEFCQATYSTDSIVSSSCNPFIWIDGKSYTKSNMKSKFTLVNAAGCDSIVTLNLYMPKSRYVYTDKHTVCDSLIWIDGFTYYKPNNSAYVIYKTIEGCDSIIVLDLEIHSNNRIDTLEACDSLTWIDGIKYTSNNKNATHTLTNIKGCDSTITLDLTIYKTPKSFIGNDTSFVIGTTLNLVGGIDSSYSYLWNNGDTMMTQEFLIENDTTITLRIESANGCFTYDTINIIINDLSVSQSSTTSILDIFPNPVHSILTVKQIIEIAKPISISIHDAKGNVLLNKAINSQLFEIDMTNYSSGLYFLIVTKGDQVSKQKIIKK